MKIPVLSTEIEIGWFDVLWLILVATLIVVVVLVRAR